MDIIRFIRNPSELIIAFGSRGLLPFVNDEEYLRILFKKKLGYSLNLENPRTFNEKIQWLKLNDHNEIYPKMVDKYEAKKYVSTIIGDEYIIPTYGVWDKIEDVNFDKLPRQFVIKCTHDSGGLVVIKDKEQMNYKAIKKFIKKNLGVNYYYRGREWPYKNIKPRIIIEEYKEDSEGELTDYKFMCFNGEVKCSFVCTERFSESGLKVTFYDRDWRVMPFERHYKKSKIPISKPENYEKMIELAERLSKDIDFVRIDFYEVNQKIFFGEITFYPGGGFEEFRPSIWDEKLGSWIQLTNKKK